MGLEWDKLWKCTEKAPRGHRCAEPERSTCCLRAVQTARGAKGRSNSHVSPLRSLTEAKKNDPHLAKVTHTGKQRPSPAPGAGRAALLPAFVPCRYLLTAARSLKKDEKNKKKASLDSPVLQRQCSGGARTPSTQSALSLCPSVPEEDIRSVLVTSGRRRAPRRPPARSTRRSLRLPGFCPSDGGLVRSKPPAGCPPRGAGPSGELQNAETQPWGLGQPLTEALPDAPADSKAPGGPEKLQGAEDACAWG